MASWLLPVFALSVAAAEEMLHIPGGKLLMGTNAADGRDGESPAREVEVRPFWVDRHPVTNSQFREFVRAEKYKTEAETFGWSFVFEDFVSEELKNKVTQRIEVLTVWFHIS